MLKKIKEKNTIFVASEKEKNNNKQNNWRKRTYTLFVVSTLRESS